MTISVGATGHKPWLLLNPGQPLQLPAPLEAASADMDGDIHRKGSAVPRARTGQVTVLAKAAAGEKIEGN